MLNITAIKAARRTKFVADAAADPEADAKRDPLETRIIMLTERVDYLTRLIEAIGDGLAEEAPVKRGPGRARKVQS